jgi:hypothetical protein
VAGLINIRLSNHRRIGADDAAHQERGDVELLPVGEIVSRHDHAFGSRFWISILASNMVCRSIFRTATRRTRAG